MEAGADLRSLEEPEVFTPALRSTKEDHYLIHHEEDAHKWRSLLGS